MLGRNRKLRNVFVGLILTLGLVSLVIAYLGSVSYLKLSIEQERKSLQQIVQMRSEDILTDLASVQQDMGAALQREGAFRAAFDNRDTQALQRQINQAFHRMFVTTELLDLRQIAVFDDRLDLLAQSTGEDSQLEETMRLYCPGMISRARERKGAERLKIMQWRCLVQGQAIQSLLVPIGGLFPKGYLQLSANPIFNLEKLSQGLDMPVQLRDHDDTLLHQSPQWPQTGSDDFLLGTLDYQGDDQSLLFKIVAAKRIGAFISSLKSSRNRVLITSVILIILTLLVVIAIMHIAFRPLIDLKIAAARIAKGQYAAIMNYSSFDEIATLIESFNRMAAGIQRENQSRARAQEALKQATLDAERLAQRAFEEKKFTQTTLDSISDGVIASSNDGRVQFMNPAAIKLTQLDPKLAIGRPLDEVFYTGEHSNLLDNEYIPRESSRELKLQQANGEQLDIEATTSVMYSPDGDVIGSVTVFSDVTRQRELTRKLSYAATHDALTGLVNRSEFERRLKKAIEDARVDGGEHAFCFMDLDQFKVVNDTCGHIAGDELLRQLASLLRAQTSAEYSLGRLGGDEFGLLMTNCNLKMAEEVANNILSSIKRYKFLWEDNTFSVGCSFGLVGFNGVSDTLATIMSAADTACYMAKDSGRNRIVVVRANNTDLEKRQGEMRWVLDINTALQQEKFELYRQLITPLHAVRNPQVRYEILIRLRDKQDGIISPDAFLPAAERFNLITKIDSWVLVTTLKWLRQQPEHPRVEVSINLSGNSIADQRFLQFVVRNIRQYQVNPNQICFEITETAAITNLSHAQRFMKIVTELGCRFALDDFGSGLSSFAYLKSLPVHYLKIDGLFIRDIHKDPVDRAMVKSINDIGHAIGLKTVAEFVENDAIVAIMREIGVDFLQGYQIARPEPLFAPLPATKTVRSQSTG